MDPLAVPKAAVLEEVQARLQMVVLVVGKNNVEDQKAVQNMVQPELQVAVQEQILEMQLDSQILRQGWEQVR